MGCPCPRGLLPCDGEDRRHDPGRAPRREAPGGLVSRRASLRHPHRKCGTALWGTYKRPPTEPGSDTRSLQTSRPAVTKISPTRRGVAPDPPGSTQTCALTPRVRRTHLDVPQWLNVRPAPTGSALTDAACSWPGGRAHRAPATASLGGRRAPRSTRSARRRQACGRPAGHQPKP